jgi:TetR/AcrR family transcriptional repressor of mexJK operon
MVDDGELPDRGQPRRGRPPSAAKGEAILAAATEAFLRDGFRETTIDAVAAAAGVSKQTVYSRFTDKETLFLAVVEAARAAGPDPMPALEGWRLAPSDLRGSLTAFGEAALAASMAEPVAALRRVMIGELGRRPQLRGLWNRDGPARMAARMVEQVYLLNETGVLDVPDVATAVGQFFALLGGPANQRSLYGVVALGEPERRRIASDAADLFVRAFARRPEHPDPQP